MASLLAPGAKAPSYALVRPKSAPAGALWSGPRSPGAAYTGVGAGWWKPSKPTTTQPSRPTTTQPAKPAYSGTTVTNPPPAAPALSTNPLDATYFQNVGANQKTTADTIAGYEKTRTDSANALPTFDYTNPVAAPQLARQYGVDVLARQIAANRGGGLFSSSLAQRIGAVGQGYQNKYTAAVTANQKLADRLAGLITGAQDAQAQYESGQRESATERASQAAQQNPALGMPTTPLVNDQYLIQGGGAAPRYTLTPPKGAPKGARWSGNTRPPGNWRGIGRGWWVPAGGKK